MMGRLRALAAAALAAACATTPVPGTYESILPAASGGGQRHVRVMLHYNGTAAVTSAFSDRPSRFLVEGTWQNDGRQVVVTLNDGKKMAFELAGHQLLAKDWDRSAWGEPGLGVLHRVR